MTTVRLLSVVSALLFAGSLPLLARGNAVTVRLDISGPELSNPIRVAGNQDLLDLSNVYAGRFIGLPANRVDSDWPHYVVTFVVGLRTPMPTLELTGIQKRYVVHYALNRQSGEGFVYLPGRGEDGYRENIGLIIRENQDGRWHHAPETWAALLNTYLP